MKAITILDELQAQIQEGYAGPVNGWTTLKTEALQSLLTSLLELVGEDEKLKTLREDKFKQSIPWQRNQLRAELRTKLNQFFKEGTDI